MTFAVYFIQTFIASIVYCVFIALKFTIQNLFYVYE